MATTIDAGPAAAGLTGALEGMRGALDSLGTNVFIADRDLRLVYMNRCAAEVMKSIGATVEKLFRVRFDDLIGTSIDAFHGERARAIRRTLEDPRNLPIRREIQVAHLTLDLNVNAIRDGQGEYAGLVVNWEEISERKRLEALGAESAAMFAAIGKSQAVIEFEMDGTVLHANENFLHALGYTLEEIKGKHHGMFVDAAYRESPEYKAFWGKLNRGEFVADEFKRIGKGGKEVWIQASYNPIFDANGKPYKVVKYATDVTAQKLQNADYAGQIAAIGRSQAVIEFRMDGTIVTANDNFLSALGYTLAEVKGKHHGIFVDAAYRDSPEYKEFWATLNRGEFVAAEFKRIGKGGKQVWIQASYNPILDLNAKPFKVVKYATDITQMVLNRLEIVRVVVAAGAGDLTQQLHVSGSDDLSKVGGQLQTFLDGLRGNMQQISEASGTLGSSSEELNVVSQSMASGAEETARQATVVSAASEEVSKSVSLVSTGSDEMLSAIREISRNATEAARVTKNAVTVAESANVTVSKLGDSSVEIGKVIKVITSIAQQTNLLALNATIEAARAGEAGKGFAVVANEVKELAKQTAKATEEIGQKIEAIQTDTKGAVESIATITTIIAQINDISTTIASAVEEQTATTNQIGRNVGEAAKGTGEIARNITEVANAAKQTMQGATETEKAAAALSQLAAELQSLVSRFKV